MSGMPGMHDCSNMLKLEQVPHLTIATIAIEISDTYSGIRNLHHIAAMHLKCTTQGRKKVSKFLASENKRKFR